MASCRGDFHEPPIIYRNIDDVLQVLNSAKESNTAVADLLDIYDSALYKYEELCKYTQKKYPIIALEGLDGSDNYYKMAQNSAKQCISYTEQKLYTEQNLPRSNRTYFELYVFPGKSTTSMRLASALNGQCWCTPPKSIKHLRNVFDHSPSDLRCAYYAIGNYIAALEVMKFLSDRPVIMDRYWHSTCAFEIAQHKAHTKTLQLPPKEDEFYTWPKDLTKPDLVIYLHVSESIRRERMNLRSIQFTDQENLLNNSEQFRIDVKRVYCNMRDPSVMFINADANYDILLPSIISKIKEYITL